MMVKLRNTILHVDGHLLDRLRQAEERVVHFPLGGPFHTHGEFQRLQARKKRKTGSKEAREFEELMWHNKAAAKMDMTHVVDCAGPVVCGTGLEHEVKKVGKRLVGLEGERVGLIVDQSSLFVDLLAGL